MDVKGVILHKHSLGPHAATSWKICLLNQQLREAGGLSHPLHHSCSHFMECACFVIPDVKKKTTKKNDTPIKKHACNYKYSVICDKYLSRMHWFVSYIRSLSDTWHNKDRIFFTLNQWFLTADGASTLPLLHMLLQHSKYVCLWCPSCSSTALQPNSRV